MKHNGRFGTFGGFYVPEALMPALEEIETAFDRYKDDPQFNADLNALYADYAGRPTPLYHARRLSDYLGFAVYIKREDLLHGGAHKINNTLGQGLLARYMKKEKLIAETGAGQHGLATATVGALFGMENKIFMGSVDVERQSLNVHKMRLLGSEVISVKGGTCTLKDAINDALRYWIANIQDTFYLFGTAGGPHPYPTIVKHFQAVISREARKQCLAQIGRLPDMVVACVGGGSNAIGAFAEFIPDKSVQLIGVEGAGHGLHTSHHCATLCKGSVGILHGAKTYLLQDENGQIHETDCISAGLDYPGVGPEHSYLKDIGRAAYVCADDEQVLDAFFLLTRMEGILPALESSHALAWLVSQKGKLPRETVAVLNLSGRGDKDIGIVEQRRPLSINPQNKS